MIRAFSCILNYQAQCFKALSLKLFLFLKALSFSLFYFKVRFFFLERSYPEARANAGLYFKKNT